MRSGFQPSCTCTSLTILIIVYLQFVTEQSCRGDGLGSEAARLMMAFSERLLLWLCACTCLSCVIGIVELGVNKFQAKIGRTNGPSQNLFKSRLGFSEVCMLVARLYAVLIYCFTINSCVVLNMTMALVPHSHMHWLSTRWTLYLNGHFILYRCPNATTTAIALEHYHVVYKLSNVFLLYYNYRYPSVKFLTKSLWKLPLRTNSYRNSSLCVIGLSMNRCRYYNVILTIVYV